MALDCLIPKSSIVNMPYDLCSPDFKSGIEKRVCKDSGVYFPSMAVVIRHRMGAGWFDTMSESNNNLEEDGNKFISLCDDQMEGDIFQLFNQ